jgi:hypothetical protein
MRNENRAARPCPSHGQRRDVLRRQIEKEFQITPTGRLMK